MDLPRGRTLELMTHSDVRGWLKDGSVSKWRKLLLVAALAYVVIPFDAVPDMLPVVGWLDDAGVVTLALTSMLADVRRRAATQKPAASR